MKGNKVQKEKKKGASAWSPRQQIKARWTGHLSAALAGSRIYIYIKIYIIPPLAWFEPVGFFWCPSHGRSTYSNSFSLFRFLLRWQKRIHFLSSWARQRFSCLNALSLCSRNDSTLTHTPRVLLYHTQTIVDFHRLPPSNIVFYFSFICSLTEGKWIYGCNQLVSFRFLMINCLCLVIPISLFRGAFLQVLLFLFSPRLQNDKKKSIPIDSSSPLISFRCVRYDELWRNSPVRAWTHLVATTHEKRRKLMIPVPIYIYYISLIYPCVSVYVCCRTGSSLPFLSLMILFLSLSISNAAAICRRLFCFLTLLSSSGEKFQSLSNQIRTVNIESIRATKKRLFLVSLWPLDMIIPLYWSIILLPVFLSLSGSLSLKMISIRCLIGHVGFFFSVSFIFRFICARHLVITHEWKRTKSFQLVAYSPRGKRGMASN